MPVSSGVFLFAEERDKRKYIIFDENDVLVKHMKRAIELTIIILLSVLYGTVAAQSSDPFQIRKWTIGDEQREAIVHIPASAKDKPSPVIFVFHGHGGNMKNMFEAHRFDKLWPDAIVVAPQGLPTPGQMLDRQGKLSGWQKGPGDMGDRDIHFFDEILSSLQKEYQIDIKRIYATGHSNGGSFTYLLWAMRADVFAAVAPSAAVAFRFNDLLKPKPVMHIMGEADPLVKPAWQQMEIAKLLKLNNCSTSGQPYGSFSTIYPPAQGDPVVVYKHPGGHTYPADANAVVVRFFKSVSKGVN